MAKTNGAKQQTEIPGTEHPDDIPEIDQASVDYLAALASAKRARNKAHAAEALLLQRIRDNKLKEYVFRDGTYKHTFLADRTARLKHKQESEAKGAGRGRGKKADAPAEFTPPGA